MKAPAASIIGFANTVIAPKINMQKTPLLKPDGRLLLIISEKRATLKSDKVPMPTTIMEIII